MTGVQTCALPILGTDGIVTTVAGTTSGFSGEGGAAAQAQINAPLGVAVDAQGNIFLSDSNNRRVRKISAGVISIYAGSGAYRFGGDGSPAVAALFNQPSDVAIGPDGSVFVSDRLNHRVRKIAKDQTITTVAGDGFARFGGDNGPATSASLNFPLGIAVDT